jgi:hypothetical protein
MITNNELNTLLNFTHRSGMPIMIHYQVDNMRIFKALTPSDYNAECSFNIAIAKSNFYDFADEYQKRLARPIEGEITDTMEKALFEIAFSANTYSIYEKSDVSIIIAPIHGLDFVLTRYINGEYEPEIYSSNDFNKFIEIIGE